MMTLKMRLRVCIVMVVLAMVYSFIIVTQSSQLATAVGIGYLALVATAMLALEFWKKP